MLIIAIPKSASTALAATLAAAHGLPIASARIRDEHLGGARTPPDYWHVAQFHRRDFVEIDERVARLVGARDSLAKFHFPPTAGNQRWLRDVKKVVLLRDAEEIVSAYRRGDETGAWRTKSYEFAFCFSERGWQRCARTTGLIDELRRFAEGWRAHDGDKLVLESAELIAEPRRLFARVEAYLGLPASGASELASERDSRAAPRRDLARMLWRRRKLILRRALVGANRLVAGDADWAHAQIERSHRRRDARRAGAGEPAR